MFESQSLNILVQEISKSLPNRRGGKTLYTDYTHLIVCKETKLTNIILDFLTLMFLIWLRSTIVGEVLCLTECEMQA